MKLLSLTFGVLLILAPAVALRAQGNSGGGTPSAGDGGGKGFGGGKRLSFLSQDDREHYLRVRKQVMDANPDLKAEQQSLMKEAQSMRNGTNTTPEDRQKVRQDFMAHHKKVDDAMKAADSTVAPIIEQVNQHMKQMFEQRAGDGAAGSGT